MYHDCIGLFETCKIFNFNCKILLWLFLIGVSSFATHSSYGWDLSDFKGEAYSPVTTKARSVLIVGAISTLGILIFEDQIIDPVQEESIEHKPLGKWSKYGDWAGQVVPNGLYVLGQSIYGINNKIGYQRSLGMFKATAYAASVTTVLKYTIREGRPNNSQERNSFPSGHTTTAFSFSGYVWGEHGFSWGIPALGISLLSAYSRINDNRHYLHDVLAGATIGFAFGLGISSYEKKGTLTFNILPIYDAHSKGIAFIKEF